MTDTLPIDVAALRERVAHAVGHAFSSTELMLEALVHKSYFNETPLPVSHNERLEFLGDAVLELIISDHLMHLVPAWPEGTLTRFRAHLVNETSLAQVARSLGIPDLILLGHGEENNNGRSKPSILSDCLEALVGAIFLDTDFDTCRDVVLPWFLPLLREVTTHPHLLDPKTALQQKLQHQGKTWEYRMVHTEGPDHDRTYEVEIAVDNKPLARGKGKSKKEAEKQAAINGLAALEDEEPCAPPSS